jgi:hypothetical protein
MILHAICVWGHYVMIDQGQAGAPAAVTAEFPRARVLAAIFLLLAVCAVAMGADILGWLPTPDKF